MLELRKDRHGWTWSADGKHPSARDFIRLGEQTPLSAGVTKWVEEGYRELGVTTAVSHGHHLWRFWLRGVHKGYLSCGLLRDSCDSIGRPYPFLVMGTGLLEGWEDNSGLLPMACSETWQSLEHLAIQSFNNVAALEIRLEQLKTPTPQWGKLGSGPANGDGAEKLDQVTIDNITTAAAEMVDSNVKHVVLDVYGNDFSDCSISQMTLLLIQKVKIIPSAVFLGGLLDRPRIIMYMRPLRPSDFLDLWSL